MNWLTIKIIKNEECDMKNIWYNFLYIHSIALKVWVFIIKRLEKEDNINVIIILIPAIIYYYNI